MDGVGRYISSQLCGVFHEDLSDLLEIIVMSFTENQIQCGLNQYIANLMNSKNILRQSFKCYHTLGCHERWWIFVYCPDRWFSTVAVDMSPSHCVTSTQFLVVNHAPVAEGRGAAVLYLSGRSRISTEQSGSFPACKRMNTKDYFLQCFLWNQRLEHLSAIWEGSHQHNCHSRTTMRKSQELPKTMLEWLSRAVRKEKLQR